MSKSRFVFDKFAKLLEEGLVNYKDFSDEVVNILRSKKEEIILKMNLVSKDEICLLYTSPSPRDATLSRMPSSA